MAGLPVVCQVCGTTWISNAIDIGPGSSASFVDVSIGPCPNCGGTGRVPDGTYTVRSAVRTLRHLDSSDLATVQAILRRTKQGEIKEDEAKEAIERAVPGAAGLLGSKSQTLAAWVAVLLGVIAVIIALRSGGGTTVNNNIEVGELNIVEGDAPSLDAAQVEEIVQEVLRQEAAVETTTPGLTPGQTAVAASNAPAVSAKVPRNAPCPCGSGKKYKRCHAAETQSGHSAS